MSKENPNPSMLRRYPIAVACAALSLLLLAVFAFRFSSRSEAATELERQTADGQKVERNVRNAVGLEDHVAALKAAVARLEAMLIGIDDVSGNQEYFYRLERDAGVRITVLNPLGASKEVAPSAVYRPAGFSIVVEGTYAQVVAFVRTLEKGSHLYHLNEFSLQAASAVQERTGPAPVALRLNFQLLGRNS